jgi:hypothetical protein
VTLFYLRSGIEHKGGWGKGFSLFGVTDPPFGGEGKRAEALLRAKRREAPSLAQLKKQPFLGCFLCEILK